MIMLNAAIDSHVSENGVVANWKGLSQCSCLGPDVSGCCRRNDVDFRDNNRAPNNTYGKKEPEAVRIVIDCRRCRRRLWATATHHQKFNRSANPKWWGFFFFAGVSDDRELVSSVGFIPGALLHVDFIHGIFFSSLSAILFEWTA